MTDFTIEELRRENEALRNRIEQRDTLAATARGLLNALRGQDHDDQGTVLEQELTARGLRLEGDETTERRQEETAGVVSYFMKGREEINESVNDSS